MSDKSKIEWTDATGPPAMQVQAFPDLSVPDRADRGGVVFLRHGLVRTITVREVGDWEPDPLPEAEGAVTGDTDE